jgi:uncharacterized membrane protein YfcA
LEKYILFYFLALIAEIIGTISGFGSSILFVPIASLYFDFKIVLGITAIFHVFSNISKIYLFKNTINKNIVIKLGIPAVVSVIVGAVLSNYVPQKELELGMNIFIVLIALLLIKYSKMTLEQSDKNLFIGGTISGFLAGIIGTGGSIRGLTLAAFNLEKNVFIATSALIDFGVDISRAVVYYFNGFILKEYLFIIPILLLISIVGTWIGKLILNKISQDFFKNIVLIVIILTAIFRVVNYISTLNINKLH